MRVVLLFTSCHDQVLTKLFNCNQKKQLHKRVFLLQRRRWVQNAGRAQTRRFPTFCARHTHSGRWKNPERSSTSPQESTCVFTPSAPAGPHNRNYVTSHSASQIITKSQGNPKKIISQQPRCETWFFMCLFFILYHLVERIAHTSAGRVHEKLLTDRAPALTEITWWEKRSKRERRLGRDEQQEFTFSFLLLHACAHTWHRTHTRLQLFPVNKTWYRRHGILWISHYYSSQ